MTKEQAFIKYLPAKAGYNIIDGGFDDDGIYYEPMFVEDHSEEVEDEYDFQIFICPPGGFDGNKAFEACIGQDSETFDTFEDAEQFINKRLIEDGHADWLN